MEGSAPDSGLLAALRAAVGGRHVLTDPDVVAAYETDWTGVFRGATGAVIRPSTTAEVALAVAACRRAGVPLVVQGGNTGLVGGSVPDGTGRAVVLSTTRMSGLGDVEPVSGQATFGAGVTLATAGEHARAAGFEVPVDLAARGTATIGGMTATNAGGTRVLRHGTMRRNVMGVEAVLGDGRVVSHLAGLEKDNTGYDLAGLLCGSEGTLGVVTAVRLRLVPVPADRCTALLALPDLAAAVATVVHLRGAVPGLEAAEYMVRPGVELVMARFGMADPFARAYPAYLLVEVSAPADAEAALTAALSTAGIVLDAAVAASASRRAELWRLRDLHTEAVASIGPPRKYDVTVAPVAVPDFIAAAATAVGASSPGTTVHHWGHLGDGNVHLNVIGLNVVGPAGDDLDDAVLGLVARFSGSISAEHGIGRLKRSWLHLSRSADEIAVFRALKRALDPDGIMNPGVLLPDS